MMKQLLLSVVLLIGLLVISELPLAMAAPIQDKQLSAGSEKIRAFHFVLRLVSPENARRMIDIAHDAGFNTVQVTITDGVQLEHAPWLPLPDAWGKDEFIAWVGYARNKGVEVVPEFQLLTHQEKFFQNNHPGLMFNSSTYDPRNKETYKQVFSLLDEIIELMQPRSVHIGHDELAGWLMKRDLLRDKAVGLQPGETGLPAELFLQDVLRIHEYLSARGIETWMWGDMLLSPDEFPTMPARQLRGGAAGYGKSLRDKLPRDIVICDWHYGSETFEFPSTGTMIKEGFRVIGATFNDRETTGEFSHYASARGARGMMATTWFYVQRKEWSKVDSIIRESGEVFSKDFPDAK